MTWLITFNCYGTRLHDPLPLTIWERQAMTEPAYGLDHCRRAIVLDAIRDICRENGTASSPRTFASPTSTS